MFRYRNMAGPRMQWLQSVQQVHVGIDNVSAYGCPRIYVFGILSKGPCGIRADFGPTPSRLKNWVWLESLCPKDIRTLDFFLKIRWADPQKIT